MMISRKSETHKPGGSGCETELPLTGRGLLTGTVEVLGGVPMGRGISRASYETLL